MPKNLKKRRVIRKTVILLEHEGQVKDCIARLDKIKGEKVLIALSPFAEYELDRRKIPYSIIEDYYDPKELYKLGMSNYKKVENLCSIIDKRIQNDCPAVAKLGIKPALFSFYHLKNIYDAATIRLFQLSKLIEAENPDVLYIFNGKRYPFGISEMAPYLFFDNRESIYARLLTCDGWGVPVVTFPCISHPDDLDVSKKTLKKRGIWRLQRYPKLFDLAAETNKHGWRGLFGGLKNYLYAGRGARLLLFGTGYNWDDCRGELKSVGISPLFIRIRDDLEYWMGANFSDKIDAGTLLKTWEGLRADDKLHKFFTWGDVNFFPVVEERLRFLVEQLTPACLNVCEKTAKILKKQKIKAFLTPTIFTCTGHSAARAARNSNIPTVTWQHGSYGSTDSPMVNYTELMGSDVYFAFGGGVVDKYVKAARRFGTRLVAIGSPSLESLFQKPLPSKVKKIVKLTPGKKVVVYVTTFFMQNNLYVSAPPQLSDNHLWRTQRAILDVLAKHSDYTVVVKTHPSLTYREPPVRLYAKENKYGDFQFIRGECDLADLVPIADLFVIDLPSTTLLQVLVTSKPMFVYTGHFYLTTKAQKLLNRRAFCYRKLGNLINAMDKYLSEGKIDKSVNLNDREFLKAYGISSLGEGSGVRAAKMLKKIISTAT